MNSKGHLIVIIVKSTIRIAGSILAILLAMQHGDIRNAITSFALCFGVAEIMGLFEELVDKF